MKPKLTIYKGSNFFKIRNFDEDIKNLAFTFTRRFIRIESNRTTSNTIGVPMTVFAAATKARDEFRFHINSFDDWIKVLNNNQIKGDLIEIIEMDKGESLDVDLPIREGWVPRDYQVPIIEFLSTEGAPVSRFVGIQTGQGKAQPLTCKVKIPGGWKEMGDIKVGDEVIAADGSVTKVNGVFPQGNKEVYKLTFADDRSTLTCAEHLWSVARYPMELHRRCLMTTKELYDLKQTGTPLSRRIAINLPIPEAGIDAELPIKPYSLGVLIGDGCLCLSKSNGALNISIIKPDEELIEKFANELPEGLYLKRSPVKTIAHFIRIIPEHRVSMNSRNPYSQTLRDLDLAGKRSYEKFIPDIYMKSSYKQKLELIQGMMDTDGTAGIDGTITYSTSSEVLADQFIYLIRSIGGIALKSPTQKYYLYKGQKLPGRINYRIHIRIKNPASLFSLTRKKERVNYENQYSKNLRLTFKSIEKENYEVPMQCISIDHPSKLYITDDFIVTHNTFTTIAALSKIKKRTIIIVKPAYMEKWASDLHQTLDISLSSIMMIRGGKHLISFLTMCDEGGLDENKFAIISNKTYQIWLKLYEEFGKEIEALGYPCVPDELFAKYKAGVRLIDEVHQDFHLNFKTDLYTNTDRCISLSATLDNYDPVTKKMYLLAYPPESRYNGGEYLKYIDTVAVSYYLEEDRRYQTSEYGQNNYSHTAFEKSIMRSSDFFAAYARMIKAIVDIGYIKRYKPGYKCIIFASTIQMCTKLTDFLDSAYPELTVRRYCEDDPYENLLEPDIRVSTVLSAGTAHDIKNLVCSVLTIALNSLQANLQTFGRLRQIEGVDTEFYYLTCQDIQKHKNYHKEKIELLTPRSASFKEIQYPRRV